MAEPMTNAQANKILALMLGLALVMGVVVAGLMLPAAALLGLGARESAKAVEKLPAAFDTGSLAETSRVLDANGNLITTLYDQNRVYRPLSQISRTMVSALLAIEDYRYYQHGAIDLKGTLRAFITNEAHSGVVQGGSSITQQLVKQTLLNEATTPAERKAAIDDSYTRKLRELRYAVALEQTHSKDWILERYLNTAYFGDGAYGVQAAAEHYFGVNASQLNVRQSALLAGLVKNPTGYDPTNYADAAVARRNVVLDRMAQLNVITQDQAEKIKQRGLGLHVRNAQNGCVSSSAQFYCDFVLKYLLQDPDLGATTEDRKTLLYSGGVTIHTTLEPANQAAAAKAVKESVFPTDQAVGAVAEVEPGTGNVLALAQSRPMGTKVKSGQTYINYTIPQSYGGAVGFQAGSTFKAFTLAAAIEKGMPLSTSFNAQHTMTFNEADYANCPGQPDFGGTWTVSNDTVDGYMNVYTGTRESVNTFYAQLEKATGVCAPYTLAKSMGIELTNPKVERFPTFTLGVDNVSPLEMANAYATFGARGLYCKPRPVDEITDSQGQVVKDYPKQCSQVMSKTTADGVSEVLRGLQEPGGWGYSAGTGLKTSTGEAIPAAGKTGTTQDGKSVWYIAYTPEIATSAMIAGADDRGRPTTLVGKIVAGSYHTVSGAGFAAPMWAKAMQPVAHTLHIVDFVPPPATVTGGGSGSYVAGPGVTVPTAPSTPDAGDTGGGDGGGNGNGNGGGGGGGGNQPPPVIKPPGKGH